MASWKTNRDNAKSSDISKLHSSIDELVNGYGSGTLLVIPVVSGHLDPYTEEWTTSESETHWPASGIICQVTNESLLLGFEGKVKVGDMMVSYPYSAVSGVLAHENIETIKLLAPVVSGNYAVTGMTMDVIRNNVLFVDFALNFSGFNGING
jgi:hypothetical protein